MLFSKVSATGLASGMRLGSALSPAATKEGHFRVPQRNCRRHNPQTLEQRCDAQLGPSQRKIQKMGPFCICAHIRCEWILGHPESKGLEDNCGCHHCEKQTSNVPFLYDVHSVIVNSWPQDELHHTANRN